MLFNQNSCVVFDLDDTIYKEIDFLKSAYRQIAAHLAAQIGKDIYQEMLQLYEEKQNVFEVILSKYALHNSSESLLEIYRFHQPTIKCSPYFRRFLQQLKKKNCKIGLITDGRSATQRNKLNSLKINRLIDFIVISEEIGTEKPNKKNYLFFEEQLGKNYLYTYIGDNPKKDFITPNQLGWQTIGVRDNGRNIHTQSLEVAPDFQPQLYISNFKELLEK